MPETAVDITTVELSIATNSTERIRAGLFIREYLDDKSQNYAKLKFNTKFFLASGQFQLFNLNEENGWHGSLPFFIRWFDSFLAVC